MRERTRLAWILAVFGLFWFLPVGHPRLWGAVQESLSLAHWYAREHVLLCLVPAFFIAGAAPGWGRRSRSSTPGRPSTCSPTS